MTTETQILQELVEAVSRPDWWAIGITAVNALFLGWLAWRQYQLQKQQTKLQEQQIRQQEYAIYSQLYKLVQKADVEIDYYLDEITSSLGVVPWKRAEDGFLQRKLDYLLELRKDLEQSAIDFEIKFSKDFFDLEGYRHILSSMTLNLRNLVKMVEEKKMIFDGAGSQTINGVDGDIEKGMAYYIAQHIKDKQYKVAISSNFLHFIEDRKKLRANGNDILEKIRERCKVE